MTDQIKKGILIFLIIAVTAAIVTSLIKVPKIIHEQSDVRLVVDAYNVKEIPKHFRKTSDTIDVGNDQPVNMTGLDTLNISGSHQFAEDSLVLVKQSIGEHRNIAIVDLRQESHGFINGIAVSWANEKNNANMGLTREQVLEKENEQLRSIPLGQPLTLNKHKKGETIIPEKVENENKLVLSQGMSYIRIPVTDGKMPTDDMTDYFVELIKRKPQNVWLHFHCKEGIGRTTTFMIMYDMMKNSTEVSAEDIIRRQVLLANLSPDSVKSFYSEERMKFLNKFYNYCRENSGHFNISWSDWNASHQ